MSMISSRFVDGERLLSELAKSRGLKFTVLRGGYFMENFLHNPHFLKALKDESTVRLFGNHSPYVDTRDIGKSAAALLANGGESSHNGQFIEMSGPERLSGQQVADVLSRVLGRAIKYEELPRAAAASMPPAIAQAVEYLYEEGDQAVPLTDDVKKLTGQHGTLEQFFRDHVKELQ